MYSLNLHVAEIRHTSTHDHNNTKLFPHEEVINNTIQFQFYCLNYRMKKLLKKLKNEDTRTDIQSTLVQY